MGFSLSRRFRCAAAGALAALAAGAAHAADAPGEPPSRLPADVAGRFCTTACRPGAGFSSGVAFAAGVAATFVVSRRRERSAGAERKRA